MIKWLRKSTSGMVVVTILRLYLGIEWTLDGFEKLTKGFDASGFIMGALKNPVMNSTGHPAYPWFTSFLKSAVKPHIGSSISLSHGVNYWLVLAFYLAP